MEPTQLRELKEIKSLPGLLEQVAVQAQCVVRVLQLDGTAVVQKCAEGSQTSFKCLTEGHSQEIVAKWYDNASSDEMSCSCGHPMTLLPIRCRGQTDGILAFCPATPEKIPLLTCVADLVGNCLSLARNGLELWAEHTNMMTAQRELYVGTESLIDADTVPIIALQIVRKYLKADVVMYLPRNDMDVGWGQPVVLNNSELSKDWLDSLARVIMASHDEDRCPLVIVAENQAEHPLFADLSLSSFISTIVSYEKETLGLIAVCSKDSGPTLSFTDLPLLETLGNLISLRIHDLQTRSLKERFFDRALHQINTPAHSVREIARILDTKKDASQDERERWIRDLNDEAERLARFVKSASAFSRMQKQEIASDRLSLNKVVSDISRSMRLEANRRQVSIKTTIPDYVCEIVGDEQTLDGALQAVVENALKFSPSGGEIQITLAEEGLTYRVSIIDQGPGVPPEQRDDIFDDCVSIARAGVPESSGLGLAMARAAIERQGGKLICSDVPDHQGACFSFTVPQAEVED